jgi:hypothetical protein
MPFSAYWELMEKLSSRGIRLVAVSKQISERDPCAV